MIENIITAIQKLSMGIEILLRAYQLLPEPARTEKLMHSLRQSALGGHYKDARAIMMSLTWDHYTPVLEEVKQEMIRGGDRLGATQIAELLGLELTVSENLLLLEEQLNFTESDSARHSVMILLTRLEEEACQKSKEAPTSPNVATE